MIGFARVGKVESPYEDLRTTKRSLWIARALTAVHVFNNKESYYDYLCIQEQKRGDDWGGSAISESEWYERWEWVERKCREYAENFK